VRSRNDALHDTAKQHAVLYAMLPTDKLVQADIAIRDCVKSLLKVSKWPHEVSPAAIHCRELMLSPSNTANMRTSDHYRRVINFPGNRLRPSTEDSGSTSVNRDGDEANAESSPVNL